jgi:dihydrolipoamide dehydrogenase
MLDISEAPDRLLIIGGGGIGVELGCIFNAVGTKVTILELMPHILPNEDPDFSDYLRELLQRKGITIKTDAKVKEIADNGSAGFSIKFWHANQEERVEGDRILVSVGRRPNVQEVGLENLNVALEAGWIKTDGHMRTNVPGVFAAGDIVGRYWFAYTASAEGVVAAENAMGGNSEIDYSVIPRCTFSDPQVASVGLTENQARAQGTNVKVGMFSFSDNSRALTMGEEDGGIKVITDSTSGEILGAHIIGPEAAELIGGIALAMKLEATIQDVGELMYIHPSLSEALKEAALDIDDKAIHRMKK